MASDRQTRMPKWADVQIRVERDFFNGGYVLTVQPAGGIGPTARVPLTESQIELLKPVTRKST